MNQLLSSKRDQYTQSNPGSVHQQHRNNNTGETQGEDGVVNGESSKDENPYRNSV